MTVTFLTQQGSKCSSRSPEQHFLHPRHQLLQKPCSSNQKPRAWARVQPQSEAAQHWHKHTSRIPSVIPRMLCQKHKQSSPQMNGRIPLEFPLLAKHTGSSLGAQGGFAELTGRVSKWFRNTTLLSLLLIYLLPTLQTLPTHRQSPAESPAAPRAFTKDFHKGGSCSPSGRTEIGIWVSLLL